MSIVKKNPIAIYNKELHQLGYLVNEKDKYYIVQEHSSKKQCQWLISNCRLVRSLRKKPTGQIIIDVDLSEDDKFDLSMECLTNPNEYFPEPVSCPADMKVDICE